MPLLDQHRLPKLELRAPTADPMLDRGGAAAFLSAHVSPTGVHEPTVLQLNLEGRFLGVGALYELVVALGRAVKAGEYGPLSIVINTSDEATRQAVSAFAELLELPIYLSSTLALEDAWPAVEVTSTQEEILRALRDRGGRGTVTDIAGEVGSAHAAVSNVLTDLANRGLVFRASGAGRRGHTYLDPSSARPAESPAHPEMLDFDVPANVREDVRALAEMQGREPSAVLLEAWREFLTKHREHMAADSRRIAQTLRTASDAATTNGSKPTVARRPSQSGKGPTQPAK